jgi:hypothetical protein
MALRQNALFDRFTIVHAGFGVWAGARGFGLLPVLVMHTAWELFEAFVMERADPDRFIFQREPMRNRVGDTIACLGGWSLNLGDRLKADPWVGDLNPIHLVYSRRDPAVSARRIEPIPQLRRVR